MTEDAPFGYTQGEVLRFKASAGPEEVTIQSRFRKRSVTIKRNGQPLNAGDILPGQVLTVNVLTGEIE